MSDYKTMYGNLFKAVTDAIIILQKSQLETEEIFISQEDPEIALLEKLRSQNSSKNK